ncbi:MAG TPA: hypothetical protein VJ182_04685 [Anaerolineales bacterium]|nr:hypothetical protein [Anaerolineales bacterium]
MKHEDWVRYQSQIEVEWLEKFGPRPKTHAEAIAELRAEVDSLEGRIKAELLDELRIEVERLISMEVSHEITTS